MPFIYGASFITTTLQQGTRIWIDRVSGLPLLSEPVIRNARPSDSTMLALALAAAFNNDPIARFYVRTDAGRNWALQTGFKKALDLYLPYGLTFVVNNGEGAALWARHDQWQLAFRQECSLMPLYMQVCGITRIMRLIRGFQALKLHHPTARHYYLCILGVHPDHQSLGLGSALLRSMLERCDDEQMPAYLEASSPHNIPFYLRHGFRVSREFQFGSGGPTVAGMWREPEQRASWQGRKSSMYEMEVGLVDSTGIKVQRCLSVPLQDNQTAKHPRC